MTVPVYVEVAQWALLLALGTLVAIMYRHLGRALAARRPTDFGPQVGSRAVSFEYMSLPGERLEYLRPGDGQATLVAFVEPSCPSCEDLVTTMGGALDAGELSGLRVLLLTSHPSGHLDTSAAFRGTRLEIGQVAAAAAIEKYNVSATPLLVAIDAEGVVRSAGPARDITEVRTAIQACLLSGPHATIPVSQVGVEHVADGGTHHHTGAVVTAARSEQEGKG